MSLSLSLSLYIRRVCWCTLWSRVNSIASSFFVIDDGRGRPKCGFKVHPSSFSYFLSRAYNKLRTVPPEKRTCDTIPRLRLQRRPLDRSWWYLLQPCGMQMHLRCSKNCCRYCSDLCTILAIQHADNVADGGGVGAVGSFRWVRQPIATSPRWLLQQQQLLPSRLVGIDSAGWTLRQLIVQKRDETNKCDITETRKTLVIHIIQS